MKGSVAAAACGVIVLSVGSVLLALSSARSLTSTPPIDTLTGARELAALRHQLQTTHTRTQRTEKQMALLSTQLALLGNKAAEPDGTYAAIATGQQEQIDSMKKQLAQLQAAQLQPSAAIAAPDRATPAATSETMDATSQGKDGVLCVLMTPPLKELEVESFWKFVGIYSEHCTAMRLAVTEKFYRRTQALNEAAWIQQANKSQNVFFSMHVLRVEENLSNLWEKTYQSFVHSFEHELNEYGWFVGMNTDAIIVVENLNRLIREQSWSANDPYFLGHTLHHRVAPGGFNAGGLYVFSRGALRKVGPRLVSLKSEVRNPNGGLEKCYDTASAEEDVKLGACFAEVGVKPTLSTSYDPHGRDSFFNFRLKADEWVTGKDRARETNCCSDYPIQAHNFKDLQEHVTVLTKLYASPSFKAEGLVSKIDWLKAEGCVGLGKHTKWASRSECP